MDLSKAKIFIDKINRELARMSKDPDNIARIDVDIMQTYIRDLYDVFLSNESPKNSAPAAVQAPLKTEPSVSAQRKNIEFSPERPSPPIPLEPPVTAQIPVVVETPRQLTPPPPVRKPEPALPPPPPVVVEKATPKPIVREPYSPTIEEIQAPKASPAPEFTAAYSEETEVLFERKQARELSEKLAERPIEDLKKGIALNDKLLMIRELFGGNAQVFDDTLTALNACSGFEQAKLYLTQNCVNRFDWLEKNRVEQAREFIKLVRRRYQ